jgi:beta-N-acetylhexosaminidase
MAASAAVRVSDAAVKESAMRSAFITGLAGDGLSHGERVFLAATRPAGIILFARNCVTPDQIHELVADAVAAIGSPDVLVLIDQEGGRVRRLRPPHWRDLPAASAFAALCASDPAGACDAARLAARLTAQELRGLGITMNCAPVLDVPVPGSHDIIGDRAYGTTPEQIAMLGRAVAQGYLDGGVVPVIKHIPGHGRATADSHLELPVVDAERLALEQTDFATFKALRDMPAAMTAHVVFTALDANAPASTSAIVTREVIRGAIGFDGLLMSDDLGMKALTGSFTGRAAAVIRAGSDVALHCGGDLAEMEAVAAGTPVLAGMALGRFERCIDVTRRQIPFDQNAAIDAIARVSAHAAVSALSAGA